MMAEEVRRPDAYRDVIDAIAAADPAAARDAAVRLLEPATTALLAALQTLEEQR
jgi:GntR family transcriptional repressor for pyruvate dehydrogenase complex